MKKGYRPGGSRIKRPDSVAIGRPKKVFLSHGAGSAALLASPLDMRSQAGKAYKNRTARLVAELGVEKPTVSQSVLVEQAVRLSLLADISWGETIRSGGIVKNGGPNPAFEGFMKAIREQRTVLAALFGDFELPEERVRVIFELPAALPPDLYARVIEHEPATDH